MLTLLSKVYGYPIMYHSDNNGTTNKFLNELRGGVSNITFIAKNKPSIPYSDDPTIPSLKKESKSSPSLKTSVRGRSQSCDSIPESLDYCPTPRKSIERRSSAKLLTVNDGIIFSINELEIEGVLGEGFFGRVSKVRKKDTGEIMVMKELKQLTRNAEKKLLNELSFLKQFHHKNLLKYIGIVLYKNLINIICEYIPGGTLRHLIKDKSIHLTPKIKEKVALGISSGMTYLHSKNIAHRDLTSKNCLLVDRINFDVVVADFGLSRVIDHMTIATGNKEEECQESVGAPCWMAPEMLKGKSYDLSVDVFSYGIILCEMLGRVSAHPDYLPRLKSFGLNELLFIEQIKNIKNPPYLVALAIKCCDIDNTLRPKFISIVNIIKAKMDHYPFKDRTPPETP